MARESSDGFSRRRFVVVLATAGGGLLLGCRVGDRLEVRGSSAAGGSEPYAFAPNAFVRIGRDGRVAVMVPLVVLGLGMYTSRPMLVAVVL
jgi:isoquinoline 1-oxidoreductase beta subunit